MEPTLTRATRGVVVLGGRGEGARLRRRLAPRPVVWGKGKEPPSARPVLGGSRPACACSPPTRPPELHVAHLATHSCAYASPVRQATATDNAVVPRVATATPALLCGQNRVGEGPELPAPHRNPHTRKAPTPRRQITTAKKSPGPPRPPRPRPKNPEPSQSPPTRPHASRAPQNRHPRTASSCSKPPGVSSFRELPRRLR